jgi:hypothetical protein
VLSDGSHTLLLLLQGRLTLLLHNLPMPLQGGPADAAASTGSTIVLLLAAQATAARPAAFAWSALHH